MTNYRNSGRELPFVVEEMYFVETGTFGDQFLRPYRSHMSESTRDEYLDAVADDSRVSNKMLAGIASKIIKPTTEAGPVIDIANGWGERRYMFHIKLRVGEHLNGGIYQYITGYTDYTEPSFNKSLDPRMRLYFNNSVTANIKDVRGPNGISRQGVVRDASHIIIPPSVIGNGPELDRRYDEVELMSPAHVMGALMTNTSPVATTDMRVGLKRNEVTKVKRDRGVATTFLTDSINGLVTAKLEMDSQNHWDENMGSGFISEDQRLYGEAGVRCREPSIVQDKWLAWLDDSTGFQYDRFISYGELCQKISYLDDLVRVHGIGGVHQESRVSERGQYENWNTSNMETVIATAFAYSVPAMMMELTLTRAVIILTNLTTDSKIDVDVKDIASFAEGVDLSRYIDRLTDRLVDELFIDLSHNGEVALWVELEVDVEYGTFIAVRYDGGPAIEYSMPTFADALYSPIVTHRRQNLDDIASHVDYMARHVGCGGSGSFTETQRNTNKGDSRYGAASRPRTRL